MCDNDPNVRSTISRCQANACVRACRQHTPHIDTWRTLRYVGLMSQQFIKWSQWSCLTRQTRVAVHPMLQHCLFCIQNGLALLWHWIHGPFHTSVQGFLGTGDHISQARFSRETAEAMRGTGSVNNAIMLKSTRVRV